MNSKELYPRIERLLSGLLRELQLEHSVSWRVSPKAKDVDLLVDAQGHDGKKIRLVVEVSANPRYLPVLQAAEKARRNAAPLSAIPVVAAPILGPSMRQWLRHEGVGYIDLDGRIFLNGNGLLVDREPREPRSAVHWASLVSLYADRSSLVLRHLLEHGSEHLGLRELAAELKISRSLASRVLGRLREDGYLVRRADGSEGVAGVEALLADWAEVYRRRAKRQEEKRYYMHARDASSVIRALGDGRNDHHLPLWALSFQAGASLVSPFAFFSEVHVVLGGDVWEESVEAFEKAYSLEPASAEANVVLVKPYYSASWDYGMRALEGVPVVSNVQLYLDLSAYPRRGSEQAARILRQIVPSGPLEARA